MKLKNMYLPIRNKWVLKRKKNLTQTQDDELGSFEEIGSGHPQSTL
jgi:hypothetical protein